MVYHIVFCDDEPEQRELFVGKIQTAFQRKELRFKLTVYADPLKLYEDLKAGKSADALFLDIDMPQLDGIRLCRMLRAHDINLPVVFLSNKDELVYRSLQVYPIRFLRKSVFDREIHEAVNAIIQFWEQRDLGRVIIQDNKQLYNLRVMEISYVEISNRTLTVHIKNRTVSVNGKLDELEKQLQSYGFLRIHKSFLVNYRYIAAIMKTDLVLEGGTILPISRRRHAEISLQFLKWTKAELSQGGVPNDI